MGKTNKKQREHRIKTTAELKELGWKIEEIGKILGVSRQTIYEYLRKAREE